MVPTRNRALGVGALTLAIGVGLFVLIAPAVEREAHIATIRTGEPDEFENALRHLCWIRSGVEQLDQLIPTLDLHRRRAVLREVVDLGCLDQLQPEVRATYYLVDAEGARNLEKAVGYERAAVAPALEALADSDPEFARRGALVIAALFRRLTDVEKRSAAELVGRLPDGAERRLLEHRLGIAPPPPEVPSAKSVEPASAPRPTPAPAAESFIPSLRPPPSFDIPRELELLGLESATEQASEPPADMVGPLPEEPAPPAFPEEPAPSRRDSGELVTPAEVHAPTPQAAPQPDDAAPANAAPDAGTSQPEVDGG